MIIKYKNQIIGKKIMRSENVLPHNIKYKKENWEIGFLGTKYHVLESIMRIGLITIRNKN